MEHQNLNATQLKIILYKSWSVVLVWRKDEIRIMYTPLHLFICHISTTNIRHYAFLTVSSLLLYSRKNFIF